MVRDSLGNLHLTQAEVELLAKAVAKEAVTEHMAQCPIVAEFRAMHIDMYGVPGQKETSPGVMGDVADLKHSRRNLLWGLRAVWGVLASAPIIAWILSHFTASTNQ